MAIRLCARSISVAIGFGVWGLCQKRPRLGRGRGAGVGGGVVEIYWVVGGEEKFVWQGFEIYFDVEFFADVDEEIGDFDGLIGVGGEVFIGPGGGLA